MNATLIMWKKRLAKASKINEKESWLTQIIALIKNNKIASYSIALVFLLLSFKYLFLFHILAAILPLYVVGKWGSYYIAAKKRGKDKVERFFENLVFGGLLMLCAQFVIVLVYALIPLPDEVLRKAVTADQCVKHLSQAVLLDDDYISVSNLYVSKLVCANRNKNSITNTHKKIVELP